MANLAYNIAGNVLNKLGSLAYEEVSLAWGMKDDLNKLKKTTSILKVVLQDAETKQEKNEELRIWLAELKDVFHDAMDVLDEFECELLRRLVVKQYASCSRKVCRFFSHSNPIVYRFNVAHRVKEIRQQLDEIAKNIEKFHLIKTQLTVEQSPPLMQESRETHSFINLSHAIGRDSEKREIIDMILMDQTHTTDNQIPVISIVGIGGLGKTTLIKAVYNEKQIIGKFDLRIWVCVSLVFNVSRIVKDILKDATGSSETSNLSNLNQLQKSLRDTLKDKKFLLVLDDVWNEDFFKWQELTELLSVGSKKSKIIVTTRNSKVAAIMGETRPYKLKGLPEKDSLSLFFKYAFRGEKEAAKYPQLKQIGEEIMKKCRGVPLALKTLGSLLRLKTEASEWKLVRDSKIWELEREEGHILPALRLSYNDMSPSLKQCLTYCSTFEEDSKMSSFKLMWIWMALGILHSPNSKVELEDVSKSHCIELCSRSFFEVANIDDYGMGQIFSVHDLIHNLACSITQNECSNMNSNDREIPDSVRYLRIVINENNLTNVSKLTKLKSIHVECTGEEKDEVVQSFISKCISRFKHLRVFDLSDLSFEVLPNSIGTMKQLRYLRMICNRKIKRLPDSICKLQSLQTLILDGCEELEELPKDIGNLVSLRILVLTTKQRFFTDGGIGRLKFIRYL